MNVEEKEKITSCKAKSYTLVTFTIDLEKFNTKKVTKPMLKMIEKRAYDLAATVGAGKKIYLNDKKIPINNFKKYVEMHIDSESALVYDDYGDWKVGVSYKPDQGFRQVSFVNGICTFKGGNHVNYIEDMIIKKLLIIMKKKSKDVKIKASHLKEHLFFFVDAMVHNPTFTSQTKEELKLTKEDFGTSCVITDSFIKRIQKTGIVDQVMQYVKIKEAAFLKKSDGKKTGTIKGINKLEDASWAGTKKSKDCILVLTEGDSAKGLAMAGRDRVGNNKVGVFPLRGKLLNIRDASPKKLADNEEIKNIKKILGLQQGKEYTSLSELRYGRVMIFADQDLDGFHIKGLVINFLTYYWPSLVDLGFLTFLPTHIVRATKGKKVLDFMTLQQFESWQKKTDTKGWYIKYYKGLGTSTSKDAKEYFTDLEKKLITYVWKDDLLTTESEEYDEVYSNDSKEDLTMKSKNALSLAFEKSLSNKRKEWLSNYDPNDIIKYDTKRIHLYDFVHKELKQFSIDDNQRSIPAKNDGLKPSLRKILYACLKKKLYTPRDEIKVSQLSGYVSEHTAYHHGEASLQGAIVGMAQDFVGKNNINLLVPNGQFGTRIEGGKDNASARYIFTYLSSITTNIFRIEDEPVLNYIDDDGKLIEPQFYYPIIPMILVNGGEGIGTGYSSNIPQFNPKEIVDNLKRLLHKKKLKELKPWYKNFKGTINKKDINSYEIKGCYEVDGDTVEITELPIGKWSSTYRMKTLDKLVETKVLKNYESLCSDKKAHFILNFNKGKITKNVEDKLKITTSIKTSNMHLINDIGVVEKFKNVNDIIKSFFSSRLEIYKTRKNYWAGRYKNDLDILKYRRKYIQYNLDKKIKVYGKTKEYVIGKIEKYKFPKLSIKYLDLDGNKNYDYITKLYQFDFTTEKIKELDNKIKNKEKELKSLLSISEEDLWEQELDEFIVEYNKWLKDNKEIDTPILNKATKKKTKRKKKVLSLR